MPHFHWLHITTPPRLFLPRTRQKKKPLSLSKAITAYCWITKIRKNCESHIDASHSRQPLVKGERLVRYEVNAVMDFLARHPAQDPAATNTSAP